MLSAETWTSTVESASRGSPAAIATTSRSRVMVGVPTPMVKTGAAAASLNKSSRKAVSPPSETRMMPPSARPRYRSAIAVSAPPMSERPADACSRPRSPGATPSPKVHTSVRNVVPSAATSDSAALRARCRRAGPSASAMRMLRDTSTRIGTTRSRADTGGTRRTGRSTAATSSTSASARSPVNSQRVRGATAAPA